MRKFYALEFKKYGIFVFILSVLFSLMPSAFVLSQTVIPFTTPGTNTFTVPAGVTSINVQAWGAGGGGGGAVTTNGTDVFGGGGGGGAYNSGVISVVPGQVITYTVGAGGSGGNTSGNGGNGGSSTFSTVSANGGNGGVNGVTTSPQGTGGNGGTGINSGGNGGTASTSYGAGGGGGAGNTGSGGNGSSGNNSAGAGGTGSPNNATYRGGIGGARINSSNNGNPGLAIGGGGGGASRTSKNGSQTGGTGGNGQIVITYTPSGTYKDSWISMNTGSSTWCPGETRTITVTVKNTGTAPWTDISGIQDINIGVKWDGDPDYLVRTDVGGLAPGGTGTFSFNVTAPAVGTNHLTFDVVYEAVSWFAGNANGVGPGNVVSTSPTLTISGPTANAGAQKAAICQGGTTAALGGAIGGSATSGTWDDGGVGGIFNQGATNVNTTWTPPAGYSGTATLTLTATSACGTTATSAKSQVVNAQPTATASGSQNICVTQTYKLPVGAATATNGTIVWTENGAGSISAGQGTLTPTYTPAAGDAGKTVILTMTVSNSPCANATATYTLNVSGTPTATTPSGSGNICTNGTFTMSGANASNGTILWTSNGAGTLSNATTLTPTYTPDASDGGKAVILTMTVSNGVCANASANYTVNVKAIPTATAGGSQTICQNGTAIVSGATSSNGTIAWTTTNGSGTITNGTTLTPSYKAVAADAGKAVILLMTVSNSPCAAATATYTINVDPLPTATAGGSQSICTTSSATVTGANATNGTIFWTSNGTGTLANATTLTPTYTPTAGDAGNAVLLTMTVTSNNTCSPTTASATYTVNVYPIPVVTTTPNTAAICSNTSTNIGLAATPNSNFSWTIGTITGGITGASWGTGSTINQALTNPSNATAGTVDYIVTPTSATGGCPGTPYTITVTVNPTPVVNTPATAEICSGTAPGINLTATAPSSFTWTTGTITGGITGASAGSGTTINQTLTNPSNSTSGSVQYLVTPTATTGSCVGTASPITVTVDPTPVVNTPNTAVICSGGNANISVESSAPATFSWTVGTITGGITGANAGSGGTGATINDVLVNPDPNIAGTVQYIVTPTSTTGSCAGVPYTITVTVDAPVVITDQPVNDTSCATFPVSFTVAATGTGLTYQWYKGGVAVSNTSNITGAQSATLNFNQVTTGDAGDYYVIVSGTTACANPQTSATAHLAVNQQIVINTQPVSEAICTGSTATFAIAATGTGLSYQWRKGNIPLTDGTLGDGAVISGSKSATLTISNATSAENASNYNVVVTTPGGGCQQAFSQNVSLTVNPIPTVNAVTSKTICNTASSGNITFSGAVAGTIYNWTNDNASIGLAASGTGNISSFTATNGGTVPVIANILVTPTYANAGTPSTTCSGTAIPFTITVNPTATVNSVANQTVCNNAPTTAINFSSPESGGTIVYNWTNNTPSIGLAATGNGNISSFAATNATSAPVTATVTVTPSYTNGVSCGGTPITFTITVNPTPVLSSSLTPPAICNNTSFSYNPTSTTSGVSFAWSRAAVPGISNAAASGTGNPNETLVNTTPAPISVVYVYTLALSDGSCPNTQNVTVVVNPTPTLTSTLAPADVCSNSLFAYTPTSATSPITFSWSRAAIAGISNAASSGTGNISETLINTSGNPIAVTYVYTLSANGCSNTQNVVVNVNPTVTIAPLSQEVCNNSAITPIDISGLPSGTIISWSRTSPGGITSTIPASGSGPISGTFTNSNTTATAVTFTINAQAGNGCISTFTATVLVDAPLVAPVVGNSQILCTLLGVTQTPAPLNGTAATGGNSTGYTYQWQSSADSTHWTNIGGATGLTYQPPVPSSSLPTYYHLVVSNACGKDTSNLVAISRANDLGGSFNTSGAPTAPLCNGDAFSYHMESTSLLSLFSSEYIRYSWQAQNPANINSTTANPFGKDSTLYFTFLFFQIPFTGYVTENPTNDPVFTVTNATNAVVSTNLYMTPIVYKSDGTILCNISATTIPVVINPTATVNNISSITVCKGSSVSATNFTSPTTGGTITYSWSNSNTAIGLGASGTGNIPAFSATNTGSSPITATITVTPSITSSMGSNQKTCAGTPTTFTITVNPSPVVTANPTTQTICSSTATNIGLSSNVTGATINWTVTSQTGASGATAGSGTSINQTLSAAGPTPGIVVYSVTSTANGCTTAAPINVTVTVNPTLVAGTVTGTSPLCIGQTATFTTNGNTGGSWSSSNPAVATVNSSTGVVTAVTAGNTNIIYTISTGCGAPVSASSALVVNPNVNSGIISGTNNPICIGSTTTFSSDGTAGGAWSSNNTGVATVNSSTGVITAVTPGNATISYTVSGCNANAPATKIITVSPDANPGTLTASGPTTICIGSTVSYTTNGDIGGTWSSDKPSVATVSPSGVVSAVSAGSANISYTLTSGCNNPKSVIATVTVNPNANAGTITGYNGVAVCATTQILLSSTGDAGGTWTSSDPTVGTVNASSGIVTGKGPGTTTITYTVNSGCNPPATATIAVSFVNAGATLTPGTITGPTGPICANTDGFTFSVDPVTDATYYVWTLPAGWSVTSANPQSNTITVKTSTTSGTISVSAGNACVNNSATSDLVIALHNVWTGTTSTKWSTGSNWADGSAPDLSCSDVYIPGGAPNQPILSSGTATINNLNIFSGATLTVTNATMQIAGAINNAGTFIASSGTIEMNGSTPQTISAATFQANDLKDLIISNTSATGVTLGGPLDVYESVTYSTNGTNLNTGGFLTLKSTATATASIGNMTGHTINGDVTVERYTNVGNGGAYHTPAWQFVAVPTFGTQTVFQSWMENGNKPTGYGTQITSPAPATGFDASSYGASLKYYNYANDTWVGIGNPTTTQVYNPEGYMLFVRGDRSIVYPNSGNTTLRTKGTLFTPQNAPPSSTVYANKFASVGNPYASAIDIRKIILDPYVNTSIYVWDPSLTTYPSAYGVGAYVLLYTDVNGNYVNLLTTPNYGDAGTVHNYIQSGQAFFVQSADDIHNGTVTFSENAKTSGSQMLFRQQSGTTAKIAQLRADLSQVNSDSSFMIKDANLIQYSDDFSDKIDGLDARKMYNAAENLGILSNGKNLAIERRTDIQANDTIFYNLTGATAQKYKIVFTATGLSAYGQQGFIEDTYLNTRKPLNMEGTTEADFTVTNAAASYAPNRFRIVFASKPPVPVALTFISLEAHQQDADIAVSWKVKNESGMKQYEVEKSADGVNFTKVATVTANNNGIGSYQWLDTQASTGDNYYRIRCVGMDGRISYSTVVKVTIAYSNPSISIYPNPITDGIIHLQFVNQPQGRYGIRLLNSLGQLISAKQVEHAGGNATENIQWNYYLSHGVYQLEVTKPDGSVKIIKVLY